MNELTDADWKRRYEDECAIVDRVWKALGVESYEDAGGKEISQLVREMRVELDRLKADRPVPSDEEIAKSFRRLHILNVCLAVAGKKHLDEACDAAEEAFAAALALVRKDERERCAEMADSFTCGVCGMDGKAGSAIRAVSKPGGGRDTLSALDRQSVDQCARPTQSFVSRKLGK